MSGDGAKMPRPVAGGLWCAGGKARHNACDAQTKLHARALVLEVAPGAAAGYRADLGQWRALLSGLREVAEPHTTASRWEKQGRHLQARLGCFNAYVPLASLH